VRIAILACAGGLLVSAAHPNILIGSWGAPDAQLKARADGATLVVGCRSLNLQPIHRDRRGRLSASGRAETNAGPQRDETMPPAPSTAAHISGGQIGSNLTLNVTIAGEASFALNMAQGRSGNQFRCL
jgi:hypothetical protein